MIRLDPGSSALRDEHEYLAALDELDDLVLAAALTTSKTVHVRHGAVSSSYRPGSPASGLDALSSASSGGTALGLLIVQALAPGPSPRRSGGLELVAAASQGLSLGRSR